MLTGEMGSAWGHGQSSLESLCDTEDFHCSGKNKTVLLKPCITYPACQRHFPKCNEFGHIAHNKQPGRQNQVNLLKQAWFQ